MVLTGTAAQLTQQADYSLAQGKLEQAIASCQKALAIDADYAPALQTMGRAFHCLGRLEEALTYYTNALQLEPNVAEIHANLGSLYAQKQDWETAIACYKKAITLNPQFAGAYRNLAKLLNQLNQIESAIDYWFQAACLEPEKATPTEHLNLGNALAQQGKFEAAIACYRNAIHFKPTFSEAYQNWAEVLRQQGKLDEAATCYRKAIELMSTLSGETSPSQQNGSLKGAVNGNSIAQPAKFQQIEAYCRQGNWQAAIALGQQIIQLQPSATAYKLLGNALQGAGQLAEAMNRYQQALSLQPDWAEVFANLGSLHAQQQQWNKAIAHYQTAITLKPDFAGAYRNLAKVWTQLENTQAAEECWYHALRLEPDQFSPETHLNFGNSLFTQGQIDRAITCYRNAIQLAPNLAGAYQNLAEALTQQQDWQAANECYRKAFELSVFQQSEEPIAEEPIAEEPIAPESPPDSIPAAYVTLGNLYAQQHRWEEAIAHIQHAIKLDPNFAEAYWQLAQIFEQQGDRSQAADAFYQALTIAPGLADAQQHFDLANQLVQQGKVTQAIACYQQTLRQDETFVGAYHNLGEILGSQGQWQAAIDHFRQAIQHNFQHTVSHFSLAKVLASQAQWNEAIAHYQQVITLEPSFLAAHLNLGEILMQQERWHEAIACYATIVQQQPDRWDAFHALGTAHLKLEHWEAANDAYAKAIALNPNFSWSHNNRGDALIHLERWEEAAAAFRRATELNPDFHWSQFNLGEVLTRLQDWEGAIAAYRRALALQPDLPYAHERLADALRQRAKRDLADALSHYRQAIEQDSNHEQLYHKALDIKPDEADLYVGLAKVLEQKGNPNGAIVFYQMALQLRPEDAFITARLERALQQKPGNLAASILTNSDDDVYAYWIKHNTPTEADLRRMADQLKTLSYQPLISIVMPVYNAPEVYLREAIDSVLNQVYPNWELCIADDASPQPHVKAVLSEYVARDERIKVAFRSENGHISACSNSALTLATGEFVSLLDHDDVLTPDALYEVISLLNRHPDADMIYSDEDKLNEHGDRINPYFKPDWCPDSFLARMYTCHLGTYRRSLIEQVGGFRLGYEGSQDYDLVLRVTEHTQKIFHIPKILYHWRIHAASAASGAAAKPYAYEAGAKAIASALNRRGEPGRVISNERFPGVYTVRYDIKDYKKVSIIIPTRNLGQVLDRCLTSIFCETRYPNYEVIVVDNGSTESETIAILSKWQQQESDRFRCYKLDVPFNFSRLNNEAVAQATGDYLLFLNNDTEVITPDWLDAMVEQAQRSSIGAVGALLLYPDDTVQHAGVLLGVAGLANHGHRRFDRNAPGYFSQLVTINNYSAVTAACLMCRREVFAQVGGFDEQLAVAYNDVDLCLKIRQQGYQNIWLPHVKIYHHESKSRGYEDTPEKQKRFHAEAALMQQRWQGWIDRDPCYNPNLTREVEDYSLNIVCTTSITVLDVSQFQSSFESLENFSIDAPDIGNSYKGFLPMRGWILGRSYAAVAIELVQNHRVFKRIPVNQPRADVAEAYPTRPEAGATGFSAMCSAIGLPPVAELGLQVVLENGDRIPIGVIKLQLDES